jgi:SH3-like domain-containing protein
VRWVNATVRGWVRVRADASQRSRTIALIGPDTRVQLGESRAGWIRVRATGLRGWVERKRFFRESELQP